eukprot:TRINITY_DN11388_c0_g1_i1.p1 TRINITY_DN11388_c0_g1~~TRINITY_DN11388_c0_g1_i1.p1  ORF type:complete len:238 (+),score=-20.40 TRINITY_DN11388_c0_g1_i1:273-986(+)
MSKSNPQKIHNKCNNKQNVTNYENLYQTMQKQFHFLLSSIRSVVPYTYIPIKKDNKNKKTYNQATLKQISLTEYPHVPYKNVIQMRKNGQNGYKVINSQLQLQDFSKVRKNKDCSNINSVKQYAQKTQQILIQVLVYFGVVMTVKQPTQSKCKQQQQQLFQEYGLLREIYYRMSHLLKQDIFILIMNTITCNIILHNKMINQFKSQICQKFFQYIHNNSNLSTYFSISIFMALKKEF